VANCSACGGPVNDIVVKCPHCGEKRDVGPAVFSRHEIEALITTDPAAHTDSTAMLKALLLPHPHSRGIMRILELGLGALAAPAILLGALGMFLFGRRRGFISYGPSRRDRSQAMLSTTGEIAPVVVMTFLGGGAFSMFGGPYALIAITAMWARAAIRMISAGQRERALIAEDAMRPNALPAARAITPQRVRPSANELPTARVVNAPSRPSAPVQPVQPVQTLQPVRSPEPQPATPSEPGDEPSILR
jgi:hypothetical protein